MLFAFVLDLFLKKLIEEVIKYVVDCRLIRGGNLDVFNFWFSFCFRHSYIVTTTSPH